MDTQSSVTRTATLEDALIELVRERGGLAPGEVVVHFDLVANTRWIKPGGDEAIERRHWCPPGTDPHLSWGVLSAQAAKIQQEKL